MTRNLHLAIIAVALALAACASAEKYEAKLKTFVGSTETHLIQAWGPPARVYEAEGLKYLTYSDDGTAYLPGTAPTYQTQAIGNTMYTNAVGGTPGMMFDYSCTTTFTVESGRVKSWRYEGDACVSD